MNAELLGALELVRVGPVVIVRELLVTDVVNPELDVEPEVAVPPVAVPVAVPEMEPLRLVATQAALLLLPAAI